MELRYIVLDGKVPAEKLSSGGHLWNEVQNFLDVGVIIPEPFIVMNFDTESDYRIMLRLVEDLKIPCRIMQTTRGCHFWFKSKIPWAPEKTRLVTGLYCDCKSHGAQVVVKQNGVLREWIKIVPENEICEVPFWLKPLVSDRYHFKGMKEKDDRKELLSEYIWVMRSNGFTVEQIHKTFEIINKFVFAVPLSNVNLASILQNCSFNKFANVGKKSSEDFDKKSPDYFNENGVFKHNVFAGILVENLNIVTINEQLYVYEDGYYQRSERTIERRMIALHPTLKRAQRMEVLDYIKLLTIVKPNKISYNEYIINLKNTRLNVKTGELLPFESSALEFCRIPVVYDANARCDDLDKTLNNVFSGDNEVINLFEEMVGYSLVKHCRFRKGFLFYGSGSNGKSTILNLLKAFIGEENCSTIELEKLSDKFKTAELENKLLNIGDDINHRDIVDTGTIKKLFTGESVTVERKGQTPFTLKSYAKMIFSCNELPRIADKSHGMYSRLMLVPFTATFCQNNEEFDPFIEDKITTPEALSYLLNLGLRGLGRLLEKKNFTHPKVVHKALDNYKTENSIALSWINDEGISEEFLLEHTTDKLFSEFKKWCTQNNIRYVPTLRTFHKDIEDRFGFGRIRKKISIDDRTYPNQCAWMFKVESA